MRDKLIQIRCHDAELNVIQANAKKAGKKVGPFLRDLGLSNGDAAFGDSQAKAERVGTSVPRSVPVAEPPVPPRPQPEGDEIDFSHVVKDAVDRLPAEITKLKGQGMTTRVATQEAKRRLGL